MEGYVGEIRYFAGNFEPMNWAFCRAQVITIQSNTALFSILGTYYGGNGTTTFGLPDLQGRVAIGTGAGPGLTPRYVGDKSGTENVSISLLNLPAHTHTAVFTPSVSGATITATLSVSSKVATDSVIGTNGSNTLGTTNVTDGSGIPANVQTYAADAAPTVSLSGLTVSASGGSATTGTVTTAITGTGGAISNMQPFLGLNPIICLRGYFPARN